MSTFKTCTQTFTNNDLQSGIYFTFLTGERVSMCLDQNWPVWMTI